MTGAAATGAIGSGVGAGASATGAAIGGRGGRGGRSHAGGCSSWQARTGTARACAVCVLVAVVLRVAVVAVVLVVTGLAAVVVSAAGAIGSAVTGAGVDATSGVAVVSAGTSTLCANKGADAEGNDGGKRGHRGANCVSVGHGLVNPYRTTMDRTNSTNRTPTGMNSKTPDFSNISGFPASFRRLADILRPSRDRMTPMTDAPTVRLFAYWHVAAARGAACELRPTARRDAGRAWRLSARGADDYRPGGGAAVGQGGAHHRVRDRQPGRPHPGCRVRTD